MSRPKTERELWNRQSGAVPRGSGGCGADAIAAFRLGAIKRLVGLPIELVRVGVLLPLRQPDRRGDRNRLTGPADQESFALDRKSRALGYARRGGDIDARHHDHEFLAAQTAQKVAAADDAAQPVRESLEHFIAHVVPISVVDDA